MSPFDAGRDWRDFVDHVVLDPRVNAAWLASVGAGRDRAELERRAADEFLRWFAEGQAQGVVVWTLRTPDGSFVGISGLVLAEPPFDGPDPEFGCLLAAEWHGLGLATEAGHAVLDDAWRRLDIGRVITVLEEPDRASRRLVDKLGFRFVEVAFDASARPYVVLAMERPVGQGAGPGISGGGLGSALGTMRP